ncbi:MAG TPA: hypothetical protein V6C65_13395 [Allocoleopsis sp.]
MSKHRPLFKNRPNLQRLEAIAQQFNPMGICWAKLSDEDLNTLESGLKKLLEEYDKIPPC